VKVAPLALQLRLEKPGDEPGIRETNELAFGEPLEARLVDALRQSAHADAYALRDYLSLVATIDERVVGHILFTPVTIEPSVDRRIAGLAPMAVRPDHQRSGIGGRLIRAGLDECRRHGYSAVVVLGHPEYYPRFGFVPAHTFGLTCEFPSPPEAFMAIELDASALSGIRGRVCYRPEFAEV
jgi:putative acetyltransferase